MRLPNGLLFRTVVISLMAAFVVQANAATLYVSPTGKRTAPYADWSSAARVIQDAVDAAADGDEIVVTNGTYLTGGRAAGTNILMNRVAVDKQVVLRSVNGPRFTVIDGQGSVRCVSLASNAFVSGFTLTNGFVKGSGGGVFCESAAAIVSNCTLTGNMASNSFGGGAYGGTLDNCTLTGNSSTYGGGASFGTLNNCIFTGNLARQGGGAYSCTLTNCALTKNSADLGGGTSSGTLRNCTVTGNSASLGSGVAGGNLGNCIVYYNIGPSDNYDPSSIMNYCCTIPLPTSGTNNFSAEPRLASGWHLSADSPCSGHGSSDSILGADIDGEPWANPPSIGCDEYWSGSATGALSTALTISYTNVAVGFTVSFDAAINGQVSASSWEFGDGVVVSNRPFASHAWADAGDYSVVLRSYNNDQPAGVAATVTVHVVAQPVHYVATSGGTPSAPYSSWASAAIKIQDAVDAATVPGALVLVSNGVYQTGSRVVYGLSNRVAVTRPVTVKSVNGPTVTRIAGYSVPGSTNGSAAMRCVYLTNGAAISGFTLTNGATQVSGDQFKQMSGGAVYCEMGSAVVSNCVLTANSAASRGGGVCFGVLNNCTLNRNTANFGGGAYNCALSRCILGGNSASSGGGTYYGTLDYCILANGSALSGGGAYTGTLNNCALTGNSISGYAPYGGGAYNCILNSCTVSGNSATGTWPYAGGAYSGTANNCILFFNAGSNGANFFPDQSIVTYSCTTPNPGGVGNITGPPLFVDFPAGNLRLQTNSPCINSGNNAGVSGPTDLDDKLRVVNGTVDMGAYEFQGIGSIISYAWLQQYGLPTDGSADFTDFDGDGLNNWQEWVAGTNPTNAPPPMRITLATRTDNPAAFTLTWESESTRMYYVQRSEDLGQPAFPTIQDNIVGQAGTTSYTDTNAVGPGPFFYRVGVKSSF